MDPLNNARRAIGLLDLTSLNDSDTPETVDALIDKSVTAHGAVAAVCVWPQFARQAVTNLSGTGVSVAAVADFPEGSGDIDRISEDIAMIRDAGAHEVDVVFPYKALMDGDIALVERALHHARLDCGQNIKLKVILESGILKDPNLIDKASHIALEQGADFLKTSTGKTEISATIEAADIMINAIKSTGSSAGFKASGGIRDLERATLFMDLADRIMGSDWISKDTFRFGASGLLDNLVAVLEQTEQNHDGTGY